MPIRVATFNVNNLFDRPRIFQNDGTPEPNVLSDVQQLEKLIAKPVYDPATKDRIRAILMKYDFHTDGYNPWFTINETRGKLFGTRDDRFEILPDHASEWVGTIEFIRDVVPSASTENTGRVIAVVKPDVLCVVEVEGRLTLDHFNRNILWPMNAAFRHVMAIDGNDRRGIDVGLMSQLPLGAIYTHIDDPDPADTDTGKLFNRDCAEYEVLLPGGQSLAMLCNHLKSKRGKPGHESADDAKRQRQADHIAEVLHDYDLAQDLVVVAGDFNDTPDSPSLAKLLATPNLFDVLSSPKLKGERWTLRHREELQQTDYLLVSKPLWEKLTAVGIERRGLVGPNSFPEVRTRTDQASDHACVWADFDLS